MSIRKQVLNTLSSRSLSTASEVLYTVNMERRANGDRPTSLGTVSSILNKEKKTGRVLAMQGFGIRGGMGYVRGRVI